MSAAASSWSASSRSFTARRSRNSEWRVASREDSSKTIRYSLLAIRYSLFAIRHFAIRHSLIVDLDIRRRDHRRPAREIGINTCAELRRRVGDRLHQLRCELFADGARGDGFGDSVIDALDD